MIVCFVWMIAITIDFHYNFTLWGSKVFESSHSFDTVTQNQSYYVGYYLDEDYVEKIHFPVQAVSPHKIRYEYGNATKTIIHYRFLKNRFNEFVFDESNYMVIRLKKGAIKSDLRSNLPVEVNDLKTRVVIKEECVDRIIHEHGKFTFYKMDNGKFSSYDFKNNESEPDKNLTFKKGDTNGHFACVNFNYSETYNRDIVDNHYKKPVYEVTVPLDFDLNSLFK